MILSICSIFFSSSFGTLVMSKFNLSPLSFALLGAMTTSAFADTTTTSENTNTHQLATIVVSAAGYEQKLTDAPASISVITKEELEKKPYMTLLDAVRDLEGVDVGETRDKTGQGTISIRGMGSDYTLILVNGRKQNNHGDIYPNSFNGNQFNHIPPLDAIERIEVIRGPASTLYGSEAMGGVINIITKKVTDTWTGSVSVGRTHQTDDSFGEDTTADFNIAGPIIKDLLGLAIRGSIYERDASTPDFESVTDPAGTVHYRSLGFGGGGKTVDNTNHALGFSLSWKPTDNQSLVFDYDISRQKYDNKPIIKPDGTEEYPLGTVDSINTIWRTGKAGGITSAQPRVGYSDSQKFERDAFALTHEGDWDWAKSFVSLGYVQTNNQGRTLPFTVAERKQLLQMIQGTGDYAGLSEAERKRIAEDTFLPRQKRTLESNQWTLDAKLDIPFELAGSHKTIVGTQISRGELIDGVFGMEEGTSGGKQENNMWSLFLEDTWNIFAPFALTTGIRYDNHEVFGDQFSPRIYGVYTFNDQWTIKGGVSTGYKPPKTTQLYDGVVGFGGQGTSPMFGNPDLKPETSISSELAAYWQHPAGHSFNATVFHNKFEDKIASQPCGTGTNLTCSNTGEYAELGYATSNKTVNIDEVVIQGAELAGRWQMVENIAALRGNYTYTDSEQKSGADKGKPLSNSAKHMANVAVDFNITDKLSTYVAYETNSKRFRSVDINGNELYYKRYGVFNLGASYKVNDMFTIHGRVNNLLDEDFTSYSTTFTDNGDGSYTPVYLDDYNNKDKARNFWLSINARF